MRSQISARSEALGGGERGEHRLADAPGASRPARKSARASAAASASSRARRSWKRVAGDLGVVGDEARVLGAEERPTSPRRRGPSAIRAAALSASGAVGVAREEGAHLARDRRASSCADEQPVGGIGLERVAGEARARSASSAFQLPLLRGVLARRAGRHRPRRRRARRRASAASSGRAQRRRQTVLMQVKAIRTAGHYLSRRKIISRPPRSGTPQFMAFDDPALLDRAAEDHRREHRALGRQRGGDRARGALAAAQAAEAGHLLGLAAPRS